MTGSDRTASGARPSGFSHCPVKSGSFGRSASFPLGVPASTQATTAAMSGSLSRASLRNFRLCAGSAGHGGIARVRTCSLMALAEDRAVSYVSSELWQVAQCLESRGAMSFVNVGTAALTATEENANTTMVSIERAEKGNIFRLSTDGITPRDSTREGRDYCLNLRLRG